ncbi:unnamed protein product [Effrenium voratum]|uniref:Acyl-CoA thioesterase n=1 Tax=Effrenium voratum TaxID=2562239 RepID=A0AA36IYM5_9DINO|nr:unnamed protein product [Effrenium voratum]
MADLRLLPSQHPTGLALRSLRAQRLAVSWSGPAIKRLGIAPCGSSERAALAAGIAALARRKRPREPRLRGRAGGDGVKLSAPFQTKMRVYIEDTDCFGVVFYANYFRFFQRALCELYAFSGWQQPFIVGIRQARYKQAAKLGDLVTVQVEPDVAPDDSSELGEWWHVTARTEEDCVTAVVQVTDGQLDLGRGEFPAMASSGPPTEISRFERHAFPVPSLHDLLRWEPALQVRRVGRAPGAAGRGGPGDPHRCGAHRPPGVLPLPGAQRRLRMGGAQSRGLQATAWPDDL